MWFYDFGGSRGSTGIVRIAWFRRPWLQQASAGHPWPACALSPYYHVFCHVETVASLDRDTGAAVAAVVVVVVVVALMLLP